MLKSMDFMDGLGTPILDISGGRWHAFPEGAPMPDTSIADTWDALARRLRADSIRATTAAGSGHPTSCLSAADMFAVLLVSHLRCDFKNPTSLDNDRLVLSK